MLKLTTSFYRYFTVTCKRLDYKAYPRNYVGLSSCQHTNRQFCSSRLLRQRSRKLLIKIPPLNDQEFDQTEQMSDSLQPAVHHTSYNGQFKVSTENISLQVARGAHTYPTSNPYPYAKYRCWETMGSSSEAGYSLKFKIVSYNVLAQYLLECHPHLYTGCSPHDLRWDIRATRIYHEIISLDPDIICLQEVQASHLQEAPYSTLMALGYACVYKQKTGSRNDGCAIFYKESLFALQDQVHVEFNQPEVPILNRDNIGLIVKLVPTVGGCPFVVATTHLLYNPRRTDVRLAQMQVLLAEIDRFAFFHDKQTPGHLPIILTGDFNSKPESAVVKLLDDGYVSAFEYQDTSNWEQIGIMNNCQHLSVFLNRQQGKATDFCKTKLFNSEYKNQPEVSRSRPEDVLHYSGYFHRDQIEYKLGLASVYDRYKSDGSAEASSYQDRWVTVDYMYFSYRNLRVTSRLRLPAADECGALYPMPNETCPSDHLLLAAAFELRPLNTSIVCTL